MFLRTYRRKRYRRSLAAVWCFLVGFLDFPGQRWRTHGDSYEEAVANGTEALESLIMAYQATGETLPEPTVNKVA